MISFLGECVKNLYKTVKYILSGEAKFSSIVSQAAMISYDSLAISLTIVFIAAAVIALQVSKQFMQTGAEDYIGGSIAIAMIREIAPGFAALAIGARAGTAICAEVSNMQVTSQIDAIKVLKIEPVGYYFAPRILAGAITVPFVIVLSEFIGILGGLIVSHFVIDLHPNIYMDSVWLWLKPKDIYISLFKAVVFGILIALVCATQGYMTKGGAKDVGISTTQAAIRSIIYLLITDLLINIVFYV